MGAKGVKGLLPCSEECIVQYRWRRRIWEGVGSSLTKPVRCGPTTACWLESVCVRLSASEARWGSCVKVSLGASPVASGICKMALVVKTSCSLQITILYFGVSFLSWLSGPEMAPVCWCWCVWDSCLCPSCCRLWPYETKYFPCCTCSDWLSLTFTEFLSLWQIKYSRFFWAGCFPCALALRFEY